METIIIYKIMEFLHVQNEMSIHPEINHIPKLKNNWNITTKGSSEFKKEEGGRDKGIGWEFFLQSIQVIRKYL